MNSPFIMKQRLLLLLFLITLNTNSQALYENLPNTGEIPITLHPGQTITSGSNQLVSIGVPFPRNTVNSISQIIITDNLDNEIASYAKETLRWYSLSNDTNVGGVRSALLYFNVVFTSLNPLNLKVKYGLNRTLELGTQGNVKDNWVTVQDAEDEYLDDINNPKYIEIKEPPVFATFPPDWLSKCVIRTKFVPVNQVSTEYQWHHDAMINFGASAVNDVANTVQEQYKVNVLERAPWLFDRAGCLWNLYFKTGELKWLKSAHKATQFYSKFLDDRGRFTLENPNFIDDLKYSFGGSMLIDIMMTGDTDLEDKIIDVAEFATRENLKLEDGYSFWTERHFTYWLLGALSAFETTGDAIYKNQVNERAAHAFDRAKNPVNGYLPEGGLLHPMGPHEGANDPGTGEDINGYRQPIISPWLSALLSDAIWRYYLHSEDRKALEFLVNLGENVAKHCIYEVTDVHPNIDGKIQPYYLFSGQTDKKFERNDIYWKPWDDSQHAPDVAALLARTFWAQKKLGLDSSEITTQINNMFATSKYTIEAWTRTAPERPKYRLQPARKFNWQFGTASDMEWFMTNIPESISLSVSDLDTNRFHIYPNPLKDILHINSNTKNTNLKLSLFDIKGIKLNSYNIKDLNIKNTINLRHLHSGIYFLIVSSKNSKQTIKFIKI
ncbi:T9SS type A sorting domain-containing protein [uncultured Algibacter sp.]|uniref:T9SS type A sorting domain-containing protein n=1 Tax=uncultured Algibacter sp. TaxID=298659 RepID=UPI003217A618